MHCETETKSRDAMKTKLELKPAELLKAATKLHRSDMFIASDTHERQKPA